MSREKSNVLSGLAHLLLHILKRGAGKGLHEFGPHNDAVVGASRCSKRTPDCLAAEWAALRCHHYLRSNLLLTLEIPKLTCPAHILDRYPDLQRRQHG
ncbi:MAG TPA: hypothetical protein VJV04_04165, partial [Nitrospiraceae bacterium]|nr:hypothetical protein [Nitrospiraceae bacterium]